MSKGYNHKISNIEFWVQNELLLLFNADLKVNLELF